jgi:hypothetical protein
MEEVEELVLLPIFQIQADRGEGVRIARLLDLVILLLQPRPKVIQGVQVVKVLVKLQVVAVVQALLVFLALVLPLDRAVQA